MIESMEALRLLKEGNKRFVSGAVRAQNSFRQASRRDLEAGQEPFAVILGCSDSRVPVEVIFDQGLSQLFVVRVAGNIVAPPQLGSIEFAVSKLGSRLVVVLGHSGCGAVRAALEDLRGQGEEQTPGWSSITDRIRESLAGLQQEDFDQSWDGLYQRAVRANIKASVDQLKEASPTLRRMIEVEGLKVVGGEYSLKTGIVDFFHGD